MLAKTWRKLYFFLSKYLYAAATGAYFLTIGLLFGRDRARLAALAEFLGWRNPIKSYPTLLPELDLRKILKSVSMDIHHPVADDGNISLLELVILNALALASGARSFFEIGTFDGRTALNLAANSPAGSVIYTLDLPDGEVEAAKRNPLGDSKFVGKTVIGCKYKDSPFEGKVVELRGDSATFDFSPYTGVIDFVFIDGAHSFHYVKCDTENALKMLRSGGIIAWHDYNRTCQGVTQVLNGLYQQGGRWKSLFAFKGTSLAALIPEEILFKLS